MRALRIREGGASVSDDGQFQESFAGSVRTADELPNSDPTKKQFGNADVYDNTQIILNSTRNPGSRAKGKCNPRDCGKRGKGTRREANVPNWEDKPVGMIIIKFKRKNMEEMMGIRRSLGVSPWMFVMRGSQAADVRYAGKDSASPSGLDWGEFGNYGADSEVGQYL